jgi:hypothetical protein
LLLSRPSSSPIERHPLTPITRNPEATTAAVADREPHHNLGNIIVKHTGNVDFNFNVATIVRMMQLLNGGYTDAQWRKVSWRERVAATVKLPGVDGSEVAVAVERLSLDIPTPDYEFLESLAVFHNFWNDAEGKRTAKRLSRKALAESLIRGQVKDLRAAMQPMIEALGAELPKIDWTNDATKKASREAMRKYVERAFAWEKKHVAKNGGGSSK